MPREAPVIRAVLFGDELLMIFSPDLSCTYLLFIWITTIIHSQDWIQTTAVWLHIF